MSGMPMLPSYWPIALALLAFGALGFRRGWVRELTTLGILLGVWLIVFTLGSGVAGALNRVALIAAFTWEGGFDAVDPAALLRSLRAAPAIDPTHPDALGLLLFCLGAFGAYLGGHRMAAVVRSGSDAVLGAMAGAVNGYVLSFVALGYLQSALRVPASEPVALLGSYATSVAVVVVVAAVTFALVSGARGSPPLKAKRSGRASA
jgi:hypothetical protein